MALPTGYPGRLRQIGPRRVAMDAALAVDAVAHGKTTKCPPRSGRNIGWLPDPRTGLAPDWPGRVLRDQDRNFMRAIVVGAQGSIARFRFADDLSGGHCLQHHVKALKPGSGVVAADDMMLPLANRICRDLVPRGRATAKGRGLLAAFTRNLWAGRDHVGERTCAVSDAVARVPTRGLAGRRFRRTRRLLKSRSQSLACRR
jgi:hypothetical protein